MDASASQGLKALKLFLDFAENHKLDVCEPTLDTESPFEDSVYEFLKDRGYEVEKQVGCAGFRVDLAIVDPLTKGSYLLGIECDGAKYHMSPVARDRDRLRQQILESLNWHIYRIWSTDWYRNRQECQQKLIDAIEKRKIEKEEFQLKVRRRDIDPPPRTELICDEEIAAAIELVLKSQYATLPDDLGVQASRLLGIKATSEKTAKRIDNIINQLVEQKKLQKMPNGMINFIGL